MGAQYIKEFEAETYAVTITGNVDKSDQKPLLATASASSTKTLHILWPHRW